jgi:hypothetical protein
VRQNIGLPAPVGDIDVEVRELSVYDELQHPEAE